MTNAVSKYQKQLTHKLNSSAMQRELMKAAGQNFDITKFLRVVLTQFQRVPQLASCTDKSIMACIFAGAQLNLSFEPAIGQAYMVPYKDHKRGVTIATFIPGYRGLISLAYRSGEVASVAGDVVYSKDNFEYSKGIEPVCKWSPSFDADRGDFIGAFSIIRLKDGTADADFMTVHEIEKIRKRSKASKSGPWVTDPDEMRKKTVFRRHLKLAPIAIEDRNLMRAVHAENLFLDDKGSDQAALFLPDEVVELKTDESQTKEKSDYNIDRDFDQRFHDLRGGTNSDLFEEFIAITAAENDLSSVADVKRAALENMVEFRTGFTKFVDARKSAEKNKGGEGKGTGGPPPYTAKPDPMKSKRNEKPSGREIPAQKSKQGDDTRPEQKSPPSSSGDDLNDILRSIPTRFRATPEFKKIREMSMSNPAVIIDALVGKNISTIADLRSVVKSLQYMKTGISEIEKNPENDDDDPFYKDIPPPEGIPGGF
jgi:recombination protein RecT